VDGVGGLSLRIDPRHALDLEVSDGTVRAVWAIGDVRHELGRAPLTGDTVLELRALPSAGHEFSTARGPDRVVAGVVDRDGFTALGEVDGRYLSTEVAGGMTGRLAGVVSSRGSVLVRSFEYEGADDPGVVGGGTADPQPWAAEGSTTP
jgi:xylan 1,4-beta-xylosidase